MQIIQQDITSVTRGVLINGVNCQAAMGSGVALSYIRKWPDVKREYLSERAHMHLGKFQPVWVDRDLYVANCWTQRFYGRDGEVYADPLAILASVSQAVLFAKDLNLPVYTPWVGCGLGGLTEKTVREVLENIEKISRKEIIVCERKSK